MLYCSWLVFSGLLSDPSGCNALGNKSDTASVVIGIFIAAFSIAYAGWDLSNSRGLFGDDETDTTKEPTENADDVELGDKKEKKSDVSETVCFYFILFCFVLFICLKNFYLLIFAIK